MAKAKMERGVKVYIFTVPKAGTYLLADFLERTGFYNTGLHVSRNNVLETKNYDLDLNAATPSRTSKKQFFMKTIRELKEGEIAFGHLPVPFCSWAVSGFKFLCAYRHPRKTMVSEFIDFRFGRNDVAWISAEAIEDDSEAFAHYLKIHGQAHMNIFSNMLAMASLYQEPLFSRFDDEEAMFINFDAFLKSPDVAQNIARFFNKNDVNVEDLWAESLSAETKTKATDIKIDRDAFWTDEAEGYYEMLNIEGYVSKARELGWTI